MFLKNCSTKGVSQIFEFRPGFTCETTGSVYGISCRRCSANSNYIAETGRTQRQRFAEQLRSIEKNLSGFLVAEHFNTNGHTIKDAQVRGIMFCDGNKQRDRQEMRLILKLGFSQPR